MGRPSKLTAAQKAEARRRRAEGATRTRAQLPRGKEHYFAARSLDYHRPMTLRAAATYLFSVIVFIVLAMTTGLISANVRKLADRHGWDNLLIRGAEQLRWERIRGLWWLWSIFGLSGGLALALWLTPFLNLGLPNHSDEPPTNINDHDHGSLNFLTAGPPFAGRVVVGGPYLQEEINKMIQAVGSLSDIIHLDIKPTFDAAKSSIENWDQQVQSEGVPAFATKLSLAANKLTSSSKRLDEIISENARYDSEIKLTVHDRDPGPFVRELGFFSSDISATVDLPYQTRTAVLTSDLARSRQAIITYDNWVYAATDNADYKVQSLRAYKPPGSK